MFKIKSTVRSHEETFVHVSLRQFLPYLYASHCFENGKDKTVTLPLYIPICTSAALGIQSPRFPAAKD